MNYKYGIAIAAAVQTENWQIVFEAQVLLENLHRSMVPPIVHRDHVGLLEE